jgi:hypothetical protein
VKKILDLSRPVALIFFGILGNISDIEEAHAVVRTLLDAAAPGSYMAVNDGAKSETRDEATRKWAEADGTPYLNRTLEEVTGFFDGLELIEPGIVSTPLWRPEPGTEPKPLGIFGGVGRKA